MITVFTGNGKGKTTSALGLALRAHGEQKKVIVLQFLKGSSYSGELLSLYQLGIPLIQFGVGCRWSAMIRSGLYHCTGCGQCFKENRRPEIANPLMDQALRYLEQLLANGEYQLIVLDEISHALNYGFIDCTRLEELLVSSTDWVLTGRRMPIELQELADEWWELEVVKHPFSIGLKSRRGIEY